MSDLKIISRAEAGLPVFANSYYQGPYNKIGVCLHNMAVHTSEPISLEAAKRYTLGNYNYHKATYGKDIMEAYDLYNVEGVPVLIEGRPWWSNSDAFSGMAKLGYVYIGLEVAGNFDTQKPSAVSLEGIVRFLTMCYDFKMIPSIHMKGHRDFNYLSNYGPTSCPGNNLYPLIPELIQEANIRIKRKESEEVMLSTPIDTKFVFPDIWQDNFKYWIHFKDETGAPNKPDEPTNTYRIIFTQGGKWNEIFKVIQTHPYERSSLDLSKLLKDTGIVGSCAITVLAARKSCVYIREFK